MTLDLDKLESLYQSTTPGPWYIRELPFAAQMFLGKAGGFIEAPRSKPDDPYDIEVLGEDETLYHTRDDDMAWIVAAHEAFPAMLERIRALTDALLVAQANLERLCDDLADRGRERDLLT